jgi:hypothetical protein
MNKVFLLAANEDWIVDRFVKEWSEDNSDMTTGLQESDVIWLLASWCWNRIPQSYLRSKKVLVTVHHVVPEKFDLVKRNEFSARDEFATAYHVYNQNTFDFVRSLTNKPVYLIPYWANQKIWKKTHSQDFLRMKYGLPINSYLIGSFQRDTEGSDLKSPKLEKGPDLFVDYVSSLSENWKESKLGRGKLTPHVVLAGWRRQYVISRLEKSGIPFTYFERPDQETLNELYQTLDVYPVCSRHEGGPQALIECGLLGIPVVSRDVGIASQVLPEKSIGNDLSLLESEIPNVLNWILPKGYEVYRKIINSL